MRPTTRLARRMLVSLALGAWVAPGVLAQPGQIEDIQVQGLFQMTQDAFMHALCCKPPGGLKPGEPYDEERIYARFKELWKMGIFEDISIEAEDGPSGGKVLIVKVKERPRLTSVSYEDNKVLTRTQIEDGLKERKVALQLGKPIDMGQVFFAEQALRELMGQRGFLDAKVTAEVRKVTETSRAVHFKITAGGKTRIRKIEFVGNEVYADGRLRKALQLTQQRKWYWPWSQKNLYHPLKWDQDVSNIRDLYQNQGYLDVNVRPPVVELREKKKKKQEAAAEPPPPPPAPEQPLTPKQAKKQAKKQRKAERKAESEGKSWVYLTVPVNEGPQYTLGEITISGNETVREELLRAQIPIGTGQILRNNLVEFGVTRMTRLYENRGHLYATVVRRIQRREGENVADVAVTVEEDEPYYVARIQFAGNSSTQDRVLRRELLLNEGELFSRDKLDLSRRKIDQLGYWQTATEPVIEPIDGENRVRITMPGEERSRNEVQIGGGYSGLDGAFFNGVYSTRNFLGRGQIVSTTLQVGGRSNRYQFSFQEPWFLNRPILLGFNVFNTEVDYGASLQSESTGAGVVIGRRVGRFSNFAVGYNIQEVTSTTTTIVNTALVSENEVSSLTPRFTSSTVNNPYRPSGGRQLNVSFRIAGGPLGGNTSYLKPMLQFNKYKRTAKKAYLAFNLQAGLVTDWEGGIEGISTGVNEVPRFERFWLGGDTLGPRVFDTRTITPRPFVRLDENGEIAELVSDPRGIPIDDLVSAPCPAPFQDQDCPVRIEVGGDRFYLLQSEFVLPLNEQAELAFFLDMGDALLDNESISYDTLRMSSGVELRFHLPIFPVPLRLIYGFPVRELNGDRSSSFTFSIGRSF